MLLRMPEKSDLNLNSKYFVNPSAAGIIFLFEKQLFLIRKSHLFCNEVVYLEFSHFLLKNVFSNMISSGNH